MARVSPITISLSALLVALLAVGVFLVVRPHHVARQGAALEPPAEPAPPPPPAPTTAMGPAILPLVRVPAPIAIVATPSDVASVSAGDDGQPPPASPVARRALLVANHNRRLQEADEQVFETLKVPEAARASIRQLNDEYRKRTESGPEHPQGPGAGEVSAASNARKDALGLILGAEPAKDFDSHERAAIGRLRGKYRFEWGRQLRQPTNN